MKKMLSILLAIMICAAAFAACGGTQKNDGATKDSAGEVTVEEQTIFDDKGIKAVVKGYGKYEDELVSYDRELLIDVTNDTGKDVTFGLRHCSVNGYMVESYYNAVIEAGKTETFPALFDTAAIEAIGVTTIADYGFCIFTEDSETMETLIESDPISVRTSAYEGFDYNYDESGTVLYDKDGVKIIAKGTQEDEFLGPCVSIYTVNNTDKGILVGVASCSVNGKEVKECAFGSEPYAGKRSIDLLSFDEEERPEKIESLTLSFKIVDWDTGEPIVEKTEPASVTF